ncbi:FCD domain-containing protein [Nocardioides sp. dk4132]|uniref:FadR/GntR family transcriptional regulator n=1 Tax=unclassified Nocardioides TaxID=2615069 RepID=UPI001296B8D2|nr:MULTISPECIES: FCD domain-containing protein [unclassified Nocardioides]MQW76809.1 FCD domain-containing protein [Nocardioides sp. dk4132]QGA06840.1 FCD domain-containing protein [Nocardioides sp. dk884]
MADHSHALSSPGAASRPGRRPASGAAAATTPRFSYPPVPPEPAELASMHGRIVERLGSQIAAGEVTGVIDPDRIATELGVSRSLVRECLRTLAAKGMVQARQRTGTTVTDPSSWALLDEQVIRWRASGSSRFVQLRESLQLRERLEPLAAGLTATHADPVVLESLADAVVRIDRATRAADPRLMIEADTAFHRLLYLGSGNDMLARLAGTVHACLRVPDFQRYQHFSSDTAARHGRLVDLVQAGDVAGAERVCGELMDLTLALFLNAHDRVIARSAPTAR